MIKNERRKKNRFFTFQIHDENKNSQQEQEESERPFVGRLSDDERCRDVVRGGGHCMPRHSHLMIEKFFGLPP